MLGNRKQITYIPYPLRENKPNEFLIEVVNILRKRYRVEGELSSWLDKSIHGQVQGLRYIYSRGLPCLASVGEDAPNTVET